jgi:hypothetical protein
VVVNYILINPAAALALQTTGRFILRRLARDLKRLEPVFVSHLEAIRFGKTPHLANGEGRS